MGSRCRTAGNLHVDDGLALRQVVFTKELLSNIGEPRGRISIFQRDANPVEAALQTLIVKAGREQTSIDCAQYFVDSVAKHKAAVVDRDACFGARKYIAVEINKILGFHFTAGESAYRRCGARGRSNSRERQPVLIPDAVYSQPPVPKTCENPAAGSVSLPVNVPAADIVPCSSIAPVPLAAKVIPVIPLLSWI